MSNCSCQFQGLIIIALFSYRWILVQCAHISVRSNSKINEFYSKIAKRRGDNKAVVAVARKLVKIIYAVLSSRNPSLYGDKIKTEKRSNG